MTPEDSRKEREARSVALEKAYVHDVYDQISLHLRGEQGRPWPKVSKFLEDLEPGSLIADVGCGNGKYLSTNNNIYKLGVDRCANIAHSTKHNCNQLLMADNLTMPVRDGSFDAALSIAVIHHFATTERRVRAIRELARILRIGGKLMISVWAMEQKHRKFESQDVLVPWRRPEHSSSDDKHSSNLEPSDQTSTGPATTTDDDEPPPFRSTTEKLQARTLGTAAKMQPGEKSDATGISARLRSKRSTKKRARTRQASDHCSNIHAMSPSNREICKTCGTIIPTTSGSQPTQLQDSGNREENQETEEEKTFTEPCPFCGSCSRVIPSEDLTCGGGASVDCGMCSSHSSSELSSPNESCYSFVRRALQVEPLSSSDTSSSSSDKQVFLKKNSPSIVFPSSSIS